MSARRINKTKVVGVALLAGLAAASYAIWHGVQPQVEPVLEALRQALYT
ncbi:hypothetical protein RE432_07885 [Pusillimonas sp. SM2304]|nr:hypothetical protein [Pusillimonas sp. SM2304]MDS1140354.1 hypothetical protein [Pusillimonas sp. SM2304]